MNNTILNEILIECDLVSFVDWASLAKQWINQRDVIPAETYAQPPPPPPPPPPEGEGKFSRRMNDKLVAISIHRLQSCKFNAIHCRWWFPSTATV